MGSLSSPLTSSFPLSLPTVIGGLQASLSRQYPFPRPPNLDLSHLVWMSSVCTRPRFLLIKTTGPPSLEGRWDLTLVAVHLYDVPPLSTCICRTRTPES